MASDELKAAVIQAAATIAVNVGHKDFDSIVKEFFRAYDVLGVFVAQGETMASNRLAELAASRNKGVGLG